LKAHPALDGLLVAQLVVKSVKDRRVPGFAVSDRRLAMPGRELLTKEILIRIPDDDEGFVYSVKCAGVTLRHGFVSIPYEKDTRVMLFAQRSATGNDERGALDNGA
jgi:hypothetical protein